MRTDRAMRIGENYILLERHYQKITKVASTFNQCLSLDIMGGRLSTKYPIHKYNMNITVV